ncbi:CpaF family protein [Streptomyces chattanoogensis]|uniref:CpaF family protein n=1 Tax=Streptomyces chattanoogensis TaxID=66876 RepID=UPI0036C33CA3
MRGRPLHAQPSVTALPVPERPSHRGAAETGYAVGGPVPQVAPSIPVEPPSGAGSVSQLPALGDVPQAVVDYRLAGEIKRQVAKRMYEWRKTAAGPVNRASWEQRSRDWINEAVALASDAAAAKRGMSPTAAEDAALAQAVFDMLHRAGRLQPYLDRADVEDILINGHDQVWLDLGREQLVQVAPVADSEEELLELLRDLARNTEAGQSERTISTASPFLALRLADGSRLQAVTAVSGDRTYVTIRRHGVQSADLADMVRLGAISETLRAFLGACVDARKNVMIVGPQRAGKTSLMRAMLRRFGPDERFATIESEFELWAHTSGYFRQVVPMEARESNGERGSDGRPVGEISMLDLMYRALRMSLSRIVVGEVRGPEVTAMMQAMTNGQGGNLCTLHATTPQMVFDRIAELYLEAGNNRSEQLAYRQAANGLDFIVFVTMTDETRIGGRRHRYVSHVLEVTGLGEHGRPATNVIFEPGTEFGEPRAVPRRRPACIDDLQRAGFPAHLLDDAYGTWTQPLELKVRPQ